MRFGARDLYSVAALCHAYDRAGEAALRTRCFQAIKRAYPDEVLPLPSLPEALNNLYVGNRS